MSKLTNSDSVMISDITILGFAEMPHNADAMVHFAIQNEWRL